MIALLLASLLNAGALSIALGDSLQPNKPVVLYWEGRAYRYGDADLAKTLLILFRITQSARDEAYAEPKSAAGVGRQMVPQWSVHGPELTKLTAPLVRAGKLKTALPTGALVTNAQLIAYLNAEAPPALARAWDVEVRPLGGRPNKRHRALDGADDPLALLLNFYSLDWPVTRRLREDLVLR